MPRRQTRNVHPSRKAAYNWFWDLMDATGLSLREIETIAENEFGESLSATTMGHWFRAKRGEEPTSPHPRNATLLAKIFQSRGARVTEEDIWYNLGLSDIPPLSPEDREVLRNLREIESIKPEAAQKIRRRVAELRAAYDAKKKNEGAMDDDPPKALGGLPSASLS